MAIAGYGCTIKVSGTSTAMTGEACTLSGGNTVAQVTAEAKRVLDPTQAVTVYDNAVALGAGDFTVDYLFGKVTILAGSFTGPVTIDAQYLPLHTIAEARSFEVQLVRDLLDTSTFGSSGWRERIAGNLDASGSLSGLALPTDDLDAGGDTLALETLLTNGTAKLLEFGFGDGGDVIRAWAKLSGISQTAAQDGLYEASPSWQLAAQAASGRSEIVGVSKGS